MDAVDVDENDARGDSPRMIFAPSFHRLHQQGAIERRVPNSSRCLSSGNSPGRSPMISDSEAAIPVLNGHAFRTWRGTPGEDALGFATNRLSSASPNRQSLRR
jgi:hypothetical protein